MSELIQFIECRTAHNRPIKRLWYKLRPKQSTTL